MYEFNWRFPFSVSDEQIPTSGATSGLKSNTLPPGFRADALLDEKVKELWSSAIATTTRSAYKAGFQCLLTFLTMSGVVIQLPELPVLSEDVLIYFVTYCHSFLKLKWSTIKLYLAGIRFHYLQAGHANPFYSVDRLQCIIRAVKRTQVSSSRTRLPIDITIIMQLCDLLHRGVFSPIIDLTLECMCLLAFFGFLRCSEFTVRSLSNPIPCLRVRDITFAPDNSMFTLNLTASKTDPFRHGVKISFFKNDKCCPVTSMLKYLQVYNRTSQDSNAPLFLDAMKRPFSREVFLSYLRDILTRLGYRSSDYSGHSFRIGAGTSAAAAGVEDHLIKTLGRWNSSCYMRYIRVSRCSLQDAQRKLCHPINSNK